MKERHGGSQSGFRTTYEDAGSRVCGGDEFGTLPMCGADSDEGRKGPTGSMLRTETVGSELGSPDWDGATLGPGVIAWQPSF